MARESGYVLPSPWRYALPIWQGILCGMALLGITVMSIRVIRKAPYFACWMVLVFGNLVPRNWSLWALPGVGRVQAMADRYAYIPLIGVFIIVSWGVPELTSKWRFKGNVLSVLSQQL